MKLNLSPTETHQTTMLGIADVSDYQGTPINTVSFEITAPGFAKQNIPFTPKSENIYTAADLGLGCDDSTLPDGLYTIKYTVNANTFIEKTFFRTTNITCQVQKLLLSLLSGDCEDWDTYKSAKLMVEGAVAAANNCQPQMAISLFAQAKKILKNNCNC